MFKCENPVETCASPFVRQFLDILATHVGAILRMRPAIDTASDGIDRTVKRYHTRRDLGLKATDLANCCHVDARGRWPIATGGSYTY